MDDLARFDSKIEVDEATGCWLWQGSTNPKGYGWFWTRPRMRLAHHWRWEQEHGPVPEGLTLDHVVCDTPGCANPAHLQLATSGDNTRRSPKTAAARNAAKTECIHGHPFDELNTRPRRDGGRECRACHLVKTRRRRAQPRA